MDVLATLFKRSAEGREGYFNLYDVDSPTFKQYIFSTAIKLTKKSKNNSFSKWIVYWEDSPFAVELSVITTVLDTGFVKATIVDKAMRPVSEIGEYTAKSSKVFGYMVNNKFVQEKDVQAEATYIVQNGKVQSTKADESTIERIKNAWGIK